MPQVFSTSPVVSAARNLYHSNHRLVFFFTAVFLLLFSSGQAQSFQEPGFTSELVTTMPPYKTVGLTFAPDGRMFLWQDDGIVRIFKNGTLLPTPFLDISNRVNYLGDRGLMGLAFDPNFSTTGFIYLYYTYEPGNDPQNYDARTQRLTRMKVSATNPDVADPNSEIVILGQIGVAPCGQYPEGSDCIGADIDSHIGGTIRFAPDGKLFLSTGDAASYNFADERALRAQNLNLYEGKILRINPDGSAPTDNPFYDGTNSVRSRIYSYGLRNPFRMALHPVTGEPYIGEVGWYSFEEINRGRGANFGWPCFEGNFPQSDYQRLFSACQALPATAVTQPLHTYGHDVGQAVIGGTFYTGTQYPSAYHHNFFFADYPSNWIRRMVLNADGTVASVQMFASNVSNPVGLEQGPDGSLYYISIVSGEVRRIRYATTAPPIAAASASPVSGSSPLTVSFSSAGSSDPNGAPLSWQWNFGDGTSSTQANPTHTYTASTNSTFTASLIVSSTSGTSLPATVNITVNAAQANRPPVATIITPTSGAAFAPGSVVNYQASATDPDETLPASAYKWNIILHHDDHVHPQLESTGPSGSFTVEAHANGTYFYELVLTVTDSGGLSDTKRLNLAPVTQGNGQLPVPWSTADVGATQPGSATFASNVFTVRGGGPDIWGDLDGFHFTHQQVAGDFTFTARVASLENTDYWAKAGLMIRENLSAGSRNVGNFVNPEAGTYFQFRNATGGFTDEIFTSRLRPALWMRLVRRGDIIEAWQSVDGVNWERVTSQSTTLPETVYIGLAVSSHSTTALATATFENVSVQSSNSQNRPPVVSITSPVNNASFNTPANITVNANADDSDGTIAKVEFYQGTVRLGEDINAPYSFDWNNVAAGNYSLTARAFDDTGASTISSPINVTVIQPNALPVVSLTAPANNASFNAPASITIIGDAADSDGTIAKVEFYQDAVKLGEDTAAPFSFTWNNVSAGSYSLTARATDNAGATTTSGAINILVNAAQANRPPVATIVTPTSGAAFAPGSVVNYQASATDPDETLPASAYKWNIILHHDNHVHPQLESIGPSGSFTVEAHANGTYFYELVLTVTDSGGLSDTKRLNLAPVTQGNGQLPVPWSTADVGATQPGSATFASNVFTVRGGGPDIWGDLDGFHFTHQQVAGDFTFTARVASLENTDYWAKAGLMIRENLSAGSRNVGNFVNPEAGTYFQFRNATGGFTDEIFTSRLRPALWMRLVRRGDIIEAWQSVDGVNWERVTSQSTTLPETVYIGLAVSSHSTTALATATFENVSVIR